MSETLTCPECFAIWVQFEPEEIVTCPECECEFEVEE